MKIKIYASLLALLGLSVFTGLFALVTWFFTAATDEQQKLVIAALLLAVVVVIIVGMYMELYRIAVIKLTNREQWKAHVEKELMP
jgi:cytochrome c biogenesis protein CcdA